MKRLAAALLLVLAGPPAAADEGQRYVHQPMTLAQPGDYRLTRDLSVVAGSALTVDSDGVAIDLAGHTLTSADATAPVIVILAGHTDISIRDGVLDGGLSGIVYDDPAGAARLRLERLRIRGSADSCVHLVGVERVDLLGSQIRGCAAAAVHVKGTASGFTGRFVANEIGQVDGDGLYLYGLRAGEIRDNEVTGAGMAATTPGGIVLTGDAAQPVGGNTVLGNRIADGSSAARGIHVAAASVNNWIRGNVLAGNEGDGLLVQSDGNRIVDNLVVAGSQDGIRVDAARNALRGNQVRGNAGEGIRVAGSFNLLDANLCEDNGSWGIWFDAAGANVYRDNMLRGNTLGAVGGSGNTDGGGNLP